ncbi:hypothetical protein BpHYR1_012428 [Brachionus plicatilis]|uniref:Uncharacterized protein n=1 Tax=Brachionus plicatilis TaxID=10195 RepID=A0A3M7SNM0_BRAPC|nr:hypothetical protein BpHYR1_012428 [Brachionus plicatilis]
MADWAIDQANLEIHDEILVGQLKFLGIVIGVTDDNSQCSEFCRVTIENLGVEMKYSENRILEIWNNFLFYLKIWHKIQLEDTKIRKNQMIEHFFSKSNSFLNFLFYENYKIPSLFREKAYAKTRTTCFSLKYGLHLDGIRNYPKIADHLPVCREFDELYRKSGLGLYFETFK